MVTTTKKTVWGCNALGCRETGRFVGCAVTCWTDKLPQTVFFNIIKMDKKKVSICTKNCRYYAKFERNFCFSNNSLYKGKCPPDDLQKCDSYKRNIAKTCAICKDKFTGYEGDICFECDMKRDIAYRLMSSENLEHISPTRIYDGIYYRIINGKDKKVCAI